MKLYNPNPTRPTTRPTDTVPVDPTPSHLSPAPQNTLTCLENVDQFAHVHAAVHQQFRPANDFQRLIADDLAEALWRNNRFSSLTNQALDFAIQTDWDSVSQRHPDVDPALRTHLAWNNVANDPAQLRADAAHARAYRRIQSDVRLLAFVARYK